MGILEKPFGHIVLKVRSSLTQRKLVRKGIVGNHQQLALFVGNELKASSVDD